MYPPKSENEIYYYFCLERFAEEDRRHVFDWMLTVAKLNGIVRSSRYTLLAHTTPDSDMSNGSPEIKLEILSSTNPATSKRRDRIETLQKTVLEKLECERRNYTDIREDTCALSTENPSFTILYEDGTPVAIQYPSTTSPHANNTLRNMHKRDAHFSVLWKSAYSVRPIMKNHSDLYLSKLHIPLSDY